MTATGPRWGEGCVHWKEYVTITIATIVAGGSVFAFVLNLHAAQPHAGAASSKQVQAIEARLSRQEDRHKETLRRIESKLDDLIKDSRK